MRRTLSAAIVTVTLVLASSPAMAKFAAEVEITGRGLDAPVLLTEADAFEYADLAGITGYREEVAAPPGDLGPRYIVRFRLLMPQPRELVQVLYPFATPEPLLYTPSRQRLFTTPRPVPGGWARADPRLVDLLESNGLARPIPDAPRPAEVVPASTQSGVYAALAVLGALVVVTAAIERRRRLVSI